MIPVQYKNHHLWSFGRWFLGKIDPERPGHLPSLVISYLSSSHGLTDSMFTLIARIFSDYFWLFSLFLVTNMYVYIYICTHMFTYIFVVYVRTGTIPLEAEIASRVNIRFHIIRELAGIRVTEPPPGKWFVVVSMWYAI